MWYRKWAGLRYGVGSGPELRCGVGSGQELRGVV